MSESGACQAESGPKVLDWPGICFDDGLYESQDMTLHAFAAMRRHFPVAIRGFTSTKGSMRHDRGGLLRRRNRRSALQHFLTLVWEVRVQQALEFCISQATLLGPFRGHPEAFDHEEVLALPAQRLLEKGGCLQIQTRPIEFSDEVNTPRSGVRIDFTDTGGGIPPETLSRLFEPFFTTKAHGSGFGLYTSYKIIESHRGKILVDSKDKTGTTFTLMLPVEQTNISANQ